MFDFNKLAKNVEKKLPFDRYIAAIAASVDDLHKIEKYANISYRFYVTKGSNTKPIYLHDIAVNKNVLDDFYTVIYFDDEIKNSRMSFYYFGNDELYLHWGKSDITIDTVYGVNILTDCIEGNCPEILDKASIFIDLPVYYTDKSADYKLDNIHKFMQTNQKFNGDVIINCNLRQYKKNIIPSIDVKKVVNLFPTCANDIFVLAEDFRIIPLESQKFLDSRNKRLFYKDFGYLKTPKLYDVYKAIYECCKKRYANYKKVVEDCNITEYDIELCFENDTDIKLENMCFEIYFVNLTVKMDASVETTGSYRPATYWEPEEYPETEVYVGDIDNIDKMTLSIFPRYLLKRRSSPFSKTGWSGMEI